MWRLPQPSLSARWARLWSTVPREQVSFRRPLFWTWELNGFWFLCIEIASEGLKGRVFEVSLADLQDDKDAERSFRKFKLIAEDVQGRNVLCNFNVMDLTTDRLRSMVKKWQVRKWVSALFWFDFSTIANDETWVFAIWCIMVTNLLPPRAEQRRN